MFWVKKYSLILAYSTFVYKYEIYFGKRSSFYFILVGLNIVFQLCNCKQLTDNCQHYHIRWKTAGFSPNPSMKSSRRTHPTPWKVKLVFKLFFGYGYLAAVFFNCSYDITLAFNVFKIGLFLWKFSNIK